MNYESLIFDIDGTLWDSRALVAEGYNIQLEKEGLEHLFVNAEQLRPLFGKIMTEIADIIFDSIPREDRYGLMERCMATENDYLHENECKIGYPKVRETLEALSKNHRLFIVSNSQCGYPELCIRKLGLEPYIQAHLCFGDTGTSKGKTIRRLMEEQNITSCAYIGDTQGDYEATLEAGVPFIWAAFGFGTPAGYTAKIDAFEDLLTLSEPASRPMNFAMDAQCLQCYLRRNIALVEPLGTPEQTMAFTRDLMRIYLDGPTDAPSPYFAPQVAQLLHRHYGLDLDRFKHEKLDSNAFVLERMEDIRKTVTAAADPVFAGLQCAILGNYLDFGALQGQVSFEKLDEMLEKALEMDLDRAVYEQLCRDLENGTRLLYVTDNAGEIGFDRVFAEAIQARYPHLDITFCVRGGPALNDATREDAAQVGLPFPVIDNGNQIPGTQLSMLSQEAKQALEEADVIIAKGMANVETMYGCGHNIYYAFLVKCQRFVGKFQKPLMTPMLVREPRK